MSLQTPEILHYQDSKLGFHEEPLAPYLEFHNIEDRFLSYSSENDRGYIGVWRIIDEKLHLVDLKGFNNDMKMVGMNAIFLDEGAIFAGWYSGEINILLNTTKTGDSKTWVKRRLIFEQGQLIDHLDIPR